MDKGIRRSIVKKINHCLPNQKLEFDEDEIKYMISRWIIDNYPDSTINKVTFHHYWEENDILQKEKIGAYIIV